MADSISNGITTLSFISLEGELDGSGTMLTEITKPAADGRAFRIVGTKGSEFRLLSTVDVANAAGASYIMGVYKTFMGDICSITIRDVTEYYYSCLMVKPLLRRRLASSKGGLVDGLYLVQAEWTFVYSGT